ncbi:MAG: hypothetical protein Q8K43_10440 [Sulfurimicrobium sp.]|nr:hypothetical protein [Gallionella sp.]MDP1898293.1 hypothetical protein [Sulfurimicrobium sp.]
MKNLIVLMLFAALSAGCQEQAEKPAQTPTPAVYQSGKITPESAKSQASKLLEIMSKVEHIASMDLTDAAVHMKHFDAPLMNEVGRWPNQYLPANADIKPYQICVEAALALSNMDAARQRTRDSSAPDVDKWRNEYHDKKSRCEESLK